MAHQPSSSFRSLPSLLAALSLAACAGTRAPTKNEPAAEEARPAGRSSMLDATTPIAAAVQREALEREAESNLPPADDPGDGTRPGRLMIYIAITGQVPLE